jgi:hypothetical protein
MPCIISERACLISEHVAEVLRKRDFCRCLVAKRGGLHARTAFMRDEMQREKAPLTSTRLVVRARSLLLANSRRY